jgi:DNA replication protein DnaC
MKCRRCNKELQSVVLPSFEGGSITLTPNLCEACEILEAEEERDWMLKEREKLIARTIPYTDNDPDRMDENLVADVGVLAFRNGRLVRRGVYLWGPVQTWKTRTLSHLAACAMRKGIPTVWVDCPKMLLSYSDALGDGGGEATSLLEGMSKVPLLVIDDFGKGVLTPRGRELLYVVIDQRLIRKLPVWYTSNNPVEFVRMWMRDDGAHHAEAVERRIKESCEIVKTGGRR